jgi:hypothetical protein
VAIVGAPREDEMPVSSSPDAPVAEETLAAGENAQDTRAPLGKDAGGAEDAPGVVMPRDEKQDEGVPVEAKGSHVGLDAEQADLVEQALKAADAELESLE